MHAIVISGEIKFRERSFVVPRGALIAELCDIEFRSIEFDMWAETEPPDIWTFRINPLCIRHINSLQDLAGQRLHVAAYEPYEDDTLDTSYDGVRTSCFRPGVEDAIAYEIWSYQTMLMDFLARGDDKFEAKFEATVGGTGPPGAIGGYSQHPLSGSILFRIDS